ncbi:dTMP kinase [Buchnera aphidicola]|uniref:dTMP kinase n=1 Tax=Buchnera aphidicola TaxID=9 RepID=UPI003BEF0590
MIKNKFIVIEGIDGSGKTNACIFIKKILNKKNIKKILLVRQPGSTHIAESIRNLIKKKFYNENMVKETELLLMYAARVQLIEKVIKPALKKGIWVISDRHDLSSLAYQGGGLNVNKKFINTLRKFLLGAFIPDLTIYLDVYPKIGLKRIYKRKVLDVIETRSLDFFTRVRKSYLKNIKLHNNIIINANKNINTVHENIKHQLLKWLKNQII